MSDLFGDRHRLLDQVELATPYRARIDSPPRVMQAQNFETDVFTNLSRGRLARDPGYGAVQRIPGIGVALAAVLVAEIGDVARFAGPEQLAC